MTRPQPVCWACWDLRDLGRMSPLRSETLAHCCFCACPTRDGLTVCVDPALVQYPQEAAS